MSTQSVLKDLIQDKKKNKKKVSKLKKKIKESSKNEKKMKYKNRIKKTEKKLKNLETKIDKLKKKAAQDKPRRPGPIDIIEEKFHLNHSPDNKLDEADLSGNYGLLVKSKRMENPMNRIFSFQVESPYNIEYWKKKQKSLPGKSNVLDSKIIQWIKSEKKPSQGTIDHTILNQFLVSSSMDPVYWIPVFNSIPPSYSIPDMSFVKVFVEKY